MSYGPSLTKGPREPTTGSRNRSRIVVSVDGSDGSWHAFAWACGEARRRGGDLVAVCAWPPRSAIMDLAAVAAPLLTAEMTEVARDIVSEIRDTASVIARDLALALTFEQRSGAQRRILQASAEQHRADLVVVAAPARRWPFRSRRVDPRWARSMGVPVVEVP
jgi:nucleotide-binding universal stress UspA family protein